MITYDYESCLALRIIKWLIYYYFCQSLKKKSEISTNYQSFHSSTTNETIFTKEYNFH